MSYREKRRSRGARKAGLKGESCHTRSLPSFVLVPFHESTRFCTPSRTCHLYPSLPSSCPRGGSRALYSPLKTLTRYQLFLGDNPRPRAGSSASHMARMKMEGHAGRFPSLSRHAWSHRPPMATFFQGVKNQPPATPNPPPSAFRTSSRLVPAAHRGCRRVVDTFRRRYTPLVREMPPQAPRRPVHRASHMAGEKCNF